MKQYLYLLAVVCFPLRHLDVTSSFGYRVHPVTGQYGFHAGIDLRAHSDTVYAVLDGHVTVGYNPWLGVYAKITNGPFCVTYGHLSQLFVAAGTLTAAMPLGVTGSTGRTTGEHLHFAVQYNHHYIDPLAFLSAAPSIINP